MNVAKEAVFAFATVVVIVIVFLLQECVRKPVVASNEVPHFLPRWHAVRDPK